MQSLRQITFLTRNILKRIRCSGTLFFALLPPTSAGLHVCLHCGLPIAHRMPGWLVHPSHMPAVESQPPHVPSVSGADLDSHDDSFGRIPPGPPRPAFPHCFFQPWPARLCSVLHLLSKPSCDPLEDWGKWKSWGSHFPGEG